MYEDLKIIFYPDPRLKKVSKPVEVFDECLRKLTERMFVLMKEARGVGLAAPQVGLNIRLFIMNPTGESADARVYVNPVLSESAGDEEGEEGCLSLPGINVNVVRGKAMKMVAKDVEGKPIEEVQVGYLPRIWQHETDHLNGILLTDHMGPVQKLASRRTLAEMREKYAAEHPAPPPPPVKKPRARAARKK